MAEPARYHPEGHHHLQTTLRKGNKSGSKSRLNPLNWIEQGSGSRKQGSEQNLETTMSQPSPWTTMSPQFPLPPPAFQGQQFQPSFNQANDYYLAVERQKLVDSERAERNSLEIIKQLTNERSIYMQKTTDLQNEIDNANRSNQSLEGNCAILRKDVEKLKKQNDELNKKLKPNEDRISSLRKTVEKLQLESSSLFHTNETLKEQHQYLKKEHESQKGIHAREQVRIKEELKHEKEVKNECQTQINILLEEQQRLKSENAMLRTDNEQLRTYIVKMEPNDLKPLRDEEYYIQGFEELKSDVEMWSARHGKANISHTVSESSEVKLFKLLEKLGEPGRGSSQFLQKHQATQIWYSNARTRIPLIRHVVALFLFRQVLEPFSVGLSPALSDALVWIDEDVMSHERDFSKALRIRQSFCLGANRYVQRNKESYQGEIVSQLAELLGLLLPGVTAVDLCKSVTKFVKKAIALKNAMTEEQAVYQCYWVQCGEQFDDEMVDVAGDEGDFVCLCTFPGMARLIRNEGATTAVRAVKASAVLQNSFIMRN